MLTVQTRSARNLTEGEFDWCSRNCYGPSGEMYDEVRYCRLNRSARDSSVTMIFEDGEPVAWSLRWRGPARRWHLYLWVCREHRRRGLGRLLMSRARMGVRGPLIVYPGSKSRRLYRPLVETGRLDVAPGYSIT